MIWVIFLSICCTCFEVAWVLSCYLLQLQSVSMKASFITKIASHLGLIGFLRWQRLSRGTKITQERKTLGLKSRFAKSTQTKIERERGKKSTRHTKITKTYYHANHKHAETKSRSFKIPPLRKSRRNLALLVFWHEICAGGTFVLLIIT
jgi:hypothetical protein